ncbi:MAG: transglycosylase domain-containing protein [Candidatus Peribacteria bacterium]|nr:MAG: transglycosylase domain-containing protein [Candidatus Peribacteria bacterium]
MHKQTEKRAHDIHSFNSHTNKMLGKPKTFRNQRIPGYSKSNRTVLNDHWKIWAWVIFVVIAIPCIAVGSRFYVRIIKQLPDIGEIENFDFKQATVITDRNGIELYKLFEENRDYVGFNEISTHFVNAIIATEDQRFWTNPGIDRKGTLRAGITDITQGKSHGGSTITQQLIKNIMLTPEKNIERKLKEIILAMKLSKYIKKDTTRMYKDLNSEELDRKVKEKILELYSNYIFLGNNSYGVETASYTYFATGAKNLDILEAAILAGIPQAPSRYDPYTNKQLLMGELIVKDKSGTPVDL